MISYPTYNKSAAPVCLRQLGAVFAILVWIDAIPHTCSMLNTYRPGFFSSLVKSCYHGDFYRQISRISFKRSLGFLSILTLLVTIFSFFALWFLVQRIDFSEEKILASFDQAVPAFDAVYDDGILETIPENFELSLGLDPDGTILFEQGYQEDLPLLLRVNTSEDIPDDILTKQRFPGAYLYRDAIFVTGGYGGSSFPYAEFELPGSVSFTKDSLAQVLTLGIPALENWTRGFLLMTAPMVIFIYYFLSNLVIAVIFSLFGMLTLLILQKPIDYAFLIKLSFYAMVPAMVIALAIAVMGAPVMFLPLVVYFAYYCYGLWVFEV